MKALSLWQPWASLIALQEKQYETRSWSTRYRGPIAIHAAKCWKPEQWQYTRVPMFHEAFQRHGIDALDAKKVLPFGAIICAVELVDIYRVEEIRGQITPQERAFGNYADGRFAWKLKFIKLPANGPIPAVGMQGLFEWSPEVNYGPGH